MQKWEISRAMSEIGKMGALARMKKLTVEERKRIAKNAGIASAKARRKIKLNDKKTIRKIEN